MSPLIKRYLALQFSKPELNTLTSYLGIIGVIAAVLVANNVGSDNFRKSMTAVGGICGGIVSLLINRPAGAEPTTYTLEHENQDEPS
jgi:uncharacterized protein YcfJ